MSRNAPGKGRALLEGLKFNTEQIETCYGHHPQNEEEAIQDGLKTWIAGNPIWRPLLDAMAFAKIGTQHCEALQEDLHRALQEQ